MVCAEDVPSGSFQFQNEARLVSPASNPQTGLPSLSAGFQSSATSSVMPPQGSSDFHQTAPKTVDVSSPSSAKPSTDSSSQEASHSSDTDQLGSSGSDIKSIMEENQKLKDERTCKICMDEEVSILFLPCGHMACCAGCSVSVQDCPICRADIVQRIKAYWSL
ncbi:death-associated inhibitor of apoptosis 2-like [Ylistrum balloti]|uniref:death-associated inhibitor of apoptosis 2-like n=1 Tax=Ylistrum balloti TaxID=509963 RepID=UPI002905B437|nr:death-associated inhibitor of apoptosis 2-like [Ylistrum balloti]